MSETTELMWRFECGDPAATERLLPLVYEELRQIARARLAREKPGQTLQATALVHEAYLRLVGTEPTGAWNSRAHFLAAAAEAMRRILIEHARAKNTLKRGGQRRRVELDDEGPALGSPCGDVDDLLALDDALHELATLDAGKAQLVELLYFAGLNLEEAAATMGMSRTTAYRHWLFARAWLCDAMTGKKAPV